MKFYLRYDGAVVGLKNARCDSALGLGMCLIFNVISTHIRKRMEQELHF